MRNRALPLLSMLAVAGLVACGEDPLAPVEPPTEAPPPNGATFEARNNVNLVIPDVVDADCVVLATSDDPGTPIYLVPFELALQAQCSAQDRYPIMAPGDHHVTLGEWMAGAGEVTVTCTGAGTRYEFDLEGLIPGGVYTVWQFNTTGEGALASHPDDINNVFTAGADGRVLFTTLGTPGPMTFGGEAPRCTLPIPSADSIAAGVWMVILYHTDHRSWGDGPGPSETGIAHLLVLGS